jgi:hypothetical protein
MTINKQRIMQDYHLDHGPPAAIVLASSQVKSKFTSLHPVVVVAVAFGGE